MKRVTKKEIKQAKDEQRWWAEVTRIVPQWQLMGWTFKTGATFITSEHTTLELTGEQRNQVVEAFARPR